MGIYLRTIIFATLLALCMSASAIAQSPPIPPPKKQALENVQRNLDAEKSAQKKLKRNLANLNNELSDTREDLVTVAKDIRRNEQDLSHLEKRIDKLEVEKEELEGRLEEDYGSIASLILALERMRRMPTESLIARPGAPLKTAQTALLLQGTLPTIHHRTEKLSSDLKTLRELEEKLAIDKATSLATKAKLDAKQAEIKGLIAKRESLYNRTQKDYEQNKATVARLSKEAKTLMDLINKLDREKTVTRLPSHKLPAIGQIQLPVYGAVINRFGQRDSIGAASQGIRIEARSGALAVAPMGGIIRFAGNFKNYGNMVIIEHKDGYHSLVAGLHTIQVGIETRIKAGEPIGQLPVASSRSALPALYYELRYKGQPVDPANRFSELKT